LGRSAIVASAAGVTWLWGNAIIACAARAVSIVVTHTDVQAEGFFLSVDEHLLLTVIADAEAESFSHTGRGIYTESFVVHTHAEGISSNERADALRHIDKIIAGTIFGTEEFPTVGLRGITNGREEKNCKNHDNSLHKRLLIAPG